MLWVWSCPINLKDLFHKIAVSERQAKSLKSNCEVVSFYYICKWYTWNLLRTNFSQAFLTDFAKAFFKDFADFPLYGIVKNLMIYFPHYQFTTLLPFFYQNFGSDFFKEHLTVVVSANTCLKVTPKKRK